MNDLKEALLTANGATVKFRGRKYKLHCEEKIDNFNCPKFTCDARNLTPKTDEESKYCYTDLAWSDSDDALALMEKFAKVGGWEPRAYTGG